MKARIINNIDFGGLYDSEYENGTWIFTETLPNDNLIKPTWNGVEWIESLSSQEITDFNNLEILQNEIELYHKRIDDGFKAIAEVSAKLRIAKLSGQITQEGHEQIETVLEPVRKEVLAGQWINALKQLEIIGNSNIGVDLYNEYHTYLSNYITNNYS